MRRSALLLFVTLVAAIAGCSNDERNLPLKEEASNNAIKPEVIAEELQIPWSIAKSGKDFYISERTGSIMRIGAGERERQGVILAKNLSSAAEAGLLGFVLAPDFAQSNEAFAYYTYDEEGDPNNRIVRLRLENGQWNEIAILLDRIPSGTFHHGGRLAIGPDGKLYATTGDASSNPEIAQDLNSLGGKILRMNLDGTIPEDNPLPQSYVYSYGHRNPQGLTWLADETMYASEHGPAANDELNQIIAGHNYGWPIIEGNEEKAGMETPLFTSGSETTWAPSGIVNYNGKLYAATLRGNAIREFDLQSSQTNEVLTGIGRIRDVFINDDFLYFITNNTDGRGTPKAGDDRLYRVRLSALLETDK